MFLSQGAIGASETWYKQATDISSFGPDATKLMALRSLTLMPDTTIQGCRIAIDGAERYSRTLLPGIGVKVDVDGTTVTIPSGNPKAWKEQIGGSDQFRAALQLEMVHNGRRVGLRYHTSIPDAITLTEPETLDRANPAEWWTRLEGYLKLLKSSAWGVKVIDKDSTNPIRAIPSWTVQSSAPGNLGIVLPALSQLTVNIGDRVKISGVRMYADGLRSPNKTWIVDSILPSQSGGNQTIFLRGSHGFDPSNFITLGTARKVSYTFLVPQFIHPYRAGIRQRGKPFGSPVGRRTKKRYAS
jgi:hypothetical protein